MDFCPITYSLLDEVTTGELSFKSSKTGKIYPAKPEYTLLASGGVEESHAISKYENILRASAYDATSLRERLVDGCRGCGRKIVSLQRLGPEKKIVYACLCGMQVIL